MTRQVKYPHLIVGGAVVCLLAYNSPSYGYLLPVLYQIFGFGIFSCLSMLKNQIRKSSKIVVYTLIVLNVSNIILYVLQKDNLYFSLSFIIIATGTGLALWTRICEESNGKRK